MPDMTAALATDFEKSSQPNMGVRKTLRRAVSSYFIPRGRFKKLLDSAEMDNEADVYRRNSGHRVFTHADWATHRTSSRYARHLALIFASRIFRSLIPPIVTIVLISVLVGVYETLHESNVLPAQWPHVTLALGQGFQLIAFALSLLLVFRTNSAYGRWWEARTMWGALTNRSRDFTRQCLSFFPEDAKRLREAAVLWTIALPYVLKAHLREGANLEAELEGILTREETAALTGATHRPCFILAALSRIVAAAGLDPQLRQRLDTNLTAFEDVIGGCERILRTPIPQSYTRHTSRFLMIWLIMMPFTLWAAYSWVSILLSGLFTYLMLGIDEIGVQIEEPFGVLPLGAMCATIERNLRELHYSDPEAKYAAMPWLMDAPLAGCDPSLRPARQTEASMRGYTTTSPSPDNPPSRLSQYISDGAALDRVHTSSMEVPGNGGPYLHSPVHPHQDTYHPSVPYPSLADAESLRPASYPSATNWAPPHRSWFGGRWVETD